MAQSEADGMTAASSVAWQWLERCGTSLVTTDTSNDDSLLPLRFFFYLGDCGTVFKRPVVVGPYGVAVVVRRRVV